MGRYSLMENGLKGSFGLLRIRSKDIAKFAFELADGLSPIHTTGMFEATLLSFSVVSRILESCVNSEIHGGLCVYVDDLCGCFSNSRINRLLNTIEQIFKG